MKLVRVQTVGAFPVDFNRRWMAVLNPERLVFPRVSSRRKAESDLPRRKVPHLAAALREVHSAVGI